MSVMARREVMDGITHGNFANVFRFEHRCGSVRKDYFRSMWSGRGPLDITSSAGTRKIACNLFAILMQLKNFTCRKARKLLLLNHK